MSLTISFLSNKKIEEPNPGIFGFESFRKTLWGSECIVNLDCVLITSLKNTDIYVKEKRDLETLKSELLLIESNVERIAKETNIPIKDILIRTTNALEFVEIARQKNAGIFIG